jgi:hypothetical protein
MAKRLDERKWRKLIVAFRDKPGNMRNAAMEANVDRATAKKAWEVGYPEQHRKPIRVVIEEEVLERAALTKAHVESVKTETAAFAAALRGDVRANALEEYERTNQYLRAAAMTATSALVAAHRLQPVVQELSILAPRLVQIVNTELLEGETTAKQAMEILEKIASFTKAIAATSNAATLQGAKVVEVSRARAGDATINIKEAVASEPFDPNEAKRIAAELAEAALEVEAAGEGAPVLTVVPGGASSQKAHVG